MFSLEIPSCYFLFPFLMDNYMVWPRNKIYNTAAIVAAAFMLVALATCSQVPYWKHKVEWDVGCHREFTFSTLSGWETIWTGSDLPCMILKWSAKSKKKKNHAIKKSIVQKLQQALATSMSLAVRDHQPAPTMYSFRDTFVGSSLKRKQTLLLSPSKFRLSVIWRW